MGKVKKTFTSFFQLKFSVIYKGFFDSPHSFFSFQQGLLEINIPLLCLKIEYIEKLTENYFYYIVCGLFLDGDSLGPVFHLYRVFFQLDV